MAAGQKIPITITGIQYGFDADGDGNIDEPLTTVQEVCAEYFQKGDAHYLFYEEQPEGFPAPLRTRIKLKNHTLEIHRQGPGGSTMFFAPGQTYRTEYPTPYGVLLLDIVTTDLQVETDVKVIAPEVVSWPGVTIEYMLQNDDELLSRYRIEIVKKK